MQTVEADMSVGSRENPRVYQGLQCRRPCGMSGIEVQRFQHACRKGYRTHDNRTEEIQPSRRTTYRAQEREAVRLVDNWNTERGKSVTKAAVHMRETGDKARAKIQGAYTQHPIREGESVWIHWSWSLQGASITYMRPK